MLDELKPYAS